MKDDKVLEDMLRQADMNTGLMRTPQEQEQYMRQQAQIAADAQAEAALKAEAQRAQVKSEANVKAAVDKGTELGIPPEETLPQIAAQNVRSPNAPQNPQTPPPSMGTAGGPTPQGGA